MVVSNLLANAIEFCREGKSVILRVWKEGVRLNIAIADEGPGIPEADRMKVFDRFIQLDTGVRKRHKGHGLGLSIAKALAEMLNGSIALAGNKGNGCVFTLSLSEMEAGRPVETTSGDGNEFIFGDGTRF